MRRITTLFTALLVALVGTAGSAGAMQPPGEPAQDNFGCVTDGGEEIDDPVAGHPGAAGIVDAAARVKGLTGDPMPTAWNAVEHADPIELGSC